MIRGKGREVGRQKKAEKRKDYMLVLVLRHDIDSNRLFGCSINAAPSWDRTISSAYGVERGETLGLARLHP